MGRIIKSTPQPTRAEGSMGYDEAMEHIKYLLDASWGDGWGSFSPDTPNVTDPKNIDYPIIVHYLEIMEPGLIGEDRREIKPRIRHTRAVDDPNGTHPEGVRVYGQVFDARIVFDVWGETNSEASQYAKYFREIITMYTGFLKSKGLKEISFASISKSMGDTGIQDSHQIYHVSYNVRFEELITEPVSYLKTIEVVEKKLKEQLKDWK